MRHFLLTLFTISIIPLLGSCGPVAHSIPEEVQPYVSSFEYITGTRTSYSIEFVQKLLFRDRSSASSPIGLCRRLSDGCKVILLSKEWYDKASPIGREQLVWHELAHCSLNAAHNDMRGALGPLSIMNTYHIPDLTYEINRAFYILELQTLARSTK